MTRLLLLVVLCLATWYYFPDARSMLLDAAQPVLAPVLRWSAKEEMTQIGRNVLDHERLTGQLPLGTAWLPWLEFRTGCGVHRTTCASRPSASEGPGRRVGAPRGEAFPRSMNPLLPRLVELLPVYGPLLLFCLAFLETSFFTGMIVPAGVATSIATVLAFEGTLDLASVVIGAAAGGAAGDSFGFWVGRNWGSRSLAWEGWGRFAVAARERQDSFSALLSRHPIYSVSVARLVSFVRTLMPMAAGMSDLTYGRFLPFELVGLAGWTIMYVGVGAFASESWELATRVIGVGGATVFVVASAVLWMTLPRRRARRRMRRSAGES